jgi:cytochrome c peroxidase
MTDMKNLFLYFLVVVTIIALYGAAFARPAEDPVGKKLFIDLKCSACHTVASVKIESKGKKPTDLSTTGATQKADFLKKFLMKQEKIKNKPHPVSFKGTPENLSILVDWLMTLKKK